jgi:SpoVK/Ycf46/Vps4 family AAA+-type ATPase
MQLTSAQATARNADDFRLQLKILSDAGVGVILCRTREPARAIASIRALAAVHQPKWNFRTWTVLNGWETHDLNNAGKKPETNGTKDPNQALQQVGGLNGDQPFPDHGFYVMYYPHHFLKPGQPIPPIIQALKEYTDQFAESERRLILIAPLGTTLPTELEEDISILDFDPPSHAELRDSYARIMKSLDKKAPIMGEADLDRLLAAGSGMSQMEFETALARATVVHKTKLPAVDPDLIISEVMKAKVEVVKRSEILEVMPTEDIANVGGLEELKEWLRKRSHCFGDDARAFGIEPPKGIALIGPPGTGKSLSAKATAKMLGLPLIKFDVSRVFAGLVGESEARVRAALKMLDAMAPCVAMLDEVDKAFQRNSGGGDSGVSQRVLGSILTHMQESSAPIFWVATANRVDNLPSEFLRRGRLDEVFSVSLPDFDERLEVLKIHLRIRGVDPDDVEELQRAAMASEGYVPAEIEAAVKDTLIDVFTAEQENVFVTGPRIAAQLANMKPLSQAFAQDFRNMQEWAENNARPASRAKAEALASARVVAPPPRSRSGTTRRIAVDAEAAAAE